MLVTYQARHKPLVDYGDDLLHQEVVIPFFLIGALQSYVAYKVYSHMNGQEHLVKSQEHFAAYEAACTTVENNDLVNDSFTTTHAKLEQRGFV